MAFISTPYSPSDPGPLPLWCLQSRVDTIFDLNKHRDTERYGKGMTEVCFSYMDGRAGGTVAGGWGRGYQEKRGGSGRLPLVRFASQRMMDGKHTCN